MKPPEDNVLRILVDEWLKKAIWIQGPEHYIFRVTRTEIMNYHPVPINLLTSVTAPLALSL
jgi:hypothetical protein